jgi:glycosyltransferase involved in cell wall biosynthesis
MDGPAMSSLHMNSVQPVSRVAGAAWPRRIGLLNDYVRIPYANGSSFASQFLYRELNARGHHVSVIGPWDPDATSRDLPPDCLMLGSGPLRNHPGVRVPLPTPGALRAIAARRLELTLGQSGSELIELGVWLRAAYGVPFLAVNTIHLPSVYNVILPDAWSESPAVRRMFVSGIVPWLERHSANVYNQGDGLIVLSRGLKRYWRERGVRVPIHVIPRAIEPKLFEREVGPDPFDRRATPGHRLLCVCRHTREKGLKRLIEIFARYIAPNNPAATLTLVGDGPDHDSFQADVQRLGVQARVFFEGELPVTRVSDYYRHADLFVYASLSETYGQVVSEALYCGLPVVAFADDMGVSEQITSGSDGVLIAPDANSHHADFRFGAEVLHLLQARSARLGFAAQARKLARLRCDPALCLDRYYDAFRDARSHCTRTWRQGGLPAAVEPLVRWTGINGALLGLGLLRAPAIINRHGRKQPNWTELMTEAPRTGSV